jgi:hypothetical protein
LTHRFCIEAFFPDCLAISLNRCRISISLPLVFISLIYAFHFPGASLSPR